MFLCCLLVCSFYWSIKAFLPEAEVRALAKERQKKDNHNLSELKDRNKNVWEFNSFFYIYTLLLIFVLILPILLFCSWKKTKVQHQRSNQRTRNADSKIQWPVRNPPFFPMLFTNRNSLALDLTKDLDARWLSSRNQPPLKHGLDCSNLIVCYCLSTWLHLSPITTGCMNVTVNSSWI